MPLADTSKVTPAHHAERILAAWAAGDEPLLHQELQKTQELNCTSAPGLEEERLELLMAASEGIRRAPAPLLGTRKDPAVRRCLDLLAHLAQTSSGIARTGRVGAN